MHGTRISTFSCLALVALALTGQAFSSSVAVGSCTALAHTYTTIQAAVNASAPGTIIEICPGIYPEQVVVNKRLTLEGIPSGGEDAAVIVPPLTGLVQNAVDLDIATSIAAQILVQNTSSVLVTISNLTVDGTGNLIDGCSPDPQGILFQNASGVLNHVAVRNEVAGGVPSGCQTGQGIFAETSTGSVSNVKIQNVSVHNYNKNGISGVDPGTTLAITGNFIQGSGVVPCSADYQGAAQNGIQLGYGATGTIFNSTVIDNNYTFDPTVPDYACYYVGADVLLYDTAESTPSNLIKIQHNWLGNSNYPLVLSEGNDFPPNYGDGVSILGNSIFGTAGFFDAIDLCTNGNTVTGNIIFNSAESAVHLDASCGEYYGGPATGTHNTVTGNTIVESACAGILDDWSGGGSNNYSSDNYYTVPYPVAYSTDSCPFVQTPEIASNRAKSNTAHNFSASKSGPTRFSPKR
jgi:hypothetical protein